MSRMRFMWAAALLVLCVGMFAGGALAVTDWEPGADNIPNAMFWDQSLAATIETTNTGTSFGDVWGLNTSILSVDTPTSTAIAHIDRWGADSVPIAGPVEPDAGGAGDFTGLYTWEMGISAPAISSLEYATPVGPTTPPTAIGLSNKWALAMDGVPVGGPYTTLPLAGHDVVVFKFSDLILDDPLTIPNEGIANGQIQELAGRLPMVVQGFTDGTYRPNNVVNRGAMAVFIQRAEQFPLGTYDGRFTDVPLDFIQAPQIMACVDNGIVQGYSDNTYHPERAVNRGQMAIFIARGLAGGDEFVPTPSPVVSSFDDVLTTDQPWKYIEYAVDSGVVQGYGDNTYRSAGIVNRGQMAIFIYRAYVQSTPSVVVLAGPAVTNVDLSTVDYNGWSTVTIGEAADPGTAYVGLDVLRLGDADVTVDFALMDGATEIDSSSVTITDIPAKKTAAQASGVPYVYATWDIPAGEPEGTYTLVASVNGEEIERQPAFTIGTPVPPAAPETVVWHPSNVSSNGNGTEAGDAAALAADDDTYYAVTNGTNGTTGFDATGPKPSGVSATTVKVIKVEIVFNTTIANPAEIGFSLMQSGSTGGKRYLDSPAETTTTDASFVFETACQDRIADALTADGNNYRIISCGTYCGSVDPYPGATYTFNTDLAEATFTLK